MFVISFVPTIISLKNNGELKFALEELSQDFEDTKGMLVKLSYHLDSVEKIYNDILEEYKKRGSK